MSTTIDTLDMPNDCDDRFFFANGSDSQSIHLDNPTIPESNPIEKIIKEQDPSILADFFAETRDHLHSAENLFLQLEVNPSDQESLNSIFRGFHTIKGTAGFLQLTDLQTLAHSSENLMDKARNGLLILHAGHIDLLLEVCDCIKFMLNGIEETLNHGNYRDPENFKSLLSRLSSQASVSIPENAIQDNSSKKLGDVLVEGKAALPQDIEDCLVRQAKGDTRKLGEILVQEKNVPVRAVAAALASQNGKAIETRHEDSLRVSVEKLDQVIDTIGEAMIMQTMIASKVAEAASANSELAHCISQMNTIMRQAQEMSMSIRMVPIKMTFQKMARLVRDLSKKCGKEVELLTQGEDTEMDKSVIELITDPIMHMVRNSIDHGMESSIQERLQAGKPSTGSITLRASQQGGNIHIEIIDDGKGLNSDIILQKAIEKGFAKPEVNYTESEIFKFIFMPGFSTAKEVSDISGRGVGMDVVRKNIEALRGSIEIQSTLGKGTSITIRLPLTLAVINGIIVRVNEERYIIPTMSVLETLKLSQNQIQTVVGKGAILHLRNEVIRIEWLASLFNLQTDKTKDSILAIVVENSSSQRVALLVDEIIDQQQIVIKVIGAGIGQTKGISGAAIMGDGSVNLILNIDELF